jgi:hypothetical protein
MVFAIPASDDTSYLTWPNALLPFWQTQGYPEAPTAWSSGE